MKLIFPMKTFRAVMPTILPFLALVALCSATYAEPSELAAPVDVGESTPPTILRASSADTTNSPSATITLTDGSVVKGLLCDEVLPAISDNLGDICLNLDIVKTIEFDRKKQDESGDHNRQTPRCRIVFSNGDLLSVRIPEQIKTLKINTLVGTLSIPLESVASVMIAHHANGGLIYHCTFDDAQSIVHPAAGPSGRYLGGEFVPGKVCKALRCPGNVPVAEVDLPEMFLQPRGTIEFWAKIEEPPQSFSDRGNPRFFNLWLSEDGSDVGPCPTYLQFTANDGMGMSGLCGMIYRHTMATDPHMSTHTYVPLLNDPAAWHHYAIVWDSEGLSFSKASDGTPAVAALVLDGQVLQTFGRNQLSKGEGLLKLPSLRGKLAFPVPSDRTEIAACRVPFLIDDFKIWSVPKTDIGLH